jgi:beta-lactam-binding protein with PASTA domain
MKLALMNPILEKTFSALRSPFAVKLYLLLAALIGLFFLFDKALMPLYVKGGKAVVVPDVSGKSFEDAEQQLKELGLVAKRGYEIYDPKKKLGTVLSQNPLPQSKVKQGRSVYLSVNTARRENVPLPDFKGRTITDAKLTLERLNLRLGKVEEVDVTKKEEDGVILSQSIAPGTNVGVETVVSFKIGRLPLQDGKLQGVLPDVLQKTLSEAEAMIVTAGFTIGRVQYRYSTSLVPNTVIAQSPKQGELVPLGKPVDLVVSTNDKQKEKEQPWIEVEDDTVSAP